MSNKLFFTASFLLLIIILITTSELSSGTKKDGRNLPPCAACKHARKHCPANCVFHPHFPPDQQSVFETAHSVFGIRNMRSALKKGTTLDQRTAMAKSFIYESSILTLKNRIKLLNDELLQLETQFAQFKSASAFDVDVQVPREDGNANGVPLEKANANADWNDRATENQNNDRDIANVEILRYNTVMAEFTPSVAVTVNPLDGFYHPAECVPPTDETSFGEFFDEYTPDEYAPNEYTPEEIQHFLDTIEQEEPME